MFVAPHQDKTYFYYSLLPEKTIEAPFLSNLMLGGIQAPLEFSRIVHVFGSNLTTLKIETVMITVPMDVIGYCCPNLVELQIINARVCTNNHRCAKVQCFSRLKLVYFFFVKYKNTPSLTAISSEKEKSLSNASGRPESALHCILYHAKLLEDLTATGTCNLTGEYVMFKTFRIFKVIFNSIQIPLVFSLLRDDQ